MRPIAAIMTIAAAFAAIDSARASTAHDAAQAATQAAVVEVRFHGNYSISDDDLLAASGIAIGDPVTDASIELIRSRLEAFEGVGGVQIHKRYRSMTNTDDVVLLIVVEEHVGVRDKFMFLPVFTWTDEYGITYGARFSTIDLLGAGERLSFPLTWGGEKEARAEASFDVDAPAITRIDAGFGALRRTNPHFEIDDTRVGGTLEAIKRWGVFELAAGLRAEDVTFGATEASQLEYGAGARIDTRQDAVLPRNAVYAGAQWQRLHLRGGGARFDRYTVDLRGYKSFVGRTIIASQAYYRGADGRLPDWERPFLGGAQTLRGYDAGEFIGDNIALLSAEWRVPLTSPAPVGLAGLNFFVDTGTVYDHGRSLRRAKFHTGAGAGVYLFVAFVGLQFDVAYGFQSESVRAHFSTGFRF